MEDLIEYMAKGLVGDPDAVKVHKSDDSEGELYELEVAGEDVGKVIGRQGRTARSLRLLVSATAARQGRRSWLEIMD